MKKPDARDESIERLLRQALGTPARGATDSCLGAEMLAAWVDGGLKGPALGRAQDHVAGCGRCQALLGSLVRTQRSAQPASEPRRWLAWLLVPLTAAAAAVSPAARTSVAKIRFMCSAPRRSE